MRSLPPWIIQLARDPLLWLRQQAIRVVFVALLLLAALIVLLFSFWVIVFFVLEPHIGALLAALSAGILLSIMTGLSAWLLSGTLGRSASSSAKTRRAPKNDDSLSSLDSVLYAFVLGAKYGRHLGNKRHAAKERQNDSA